MKRISFKSALFSLSAAVAVVVASVIAADSQIVLLGGESFHSSNLNSSGTPGYSLDISTTCDSTQLNGTVNYSLTGSAAGPYTGTYSEQGSFTLSNGTVTNLSASFTISPSGGGSAITGNKTLGGPAGTFKGNCSSTGGSSSTRNAVASGLFNYTADVNGTPVTGVGGMALDITETATNSTGTGFGHTNFHGVSASTESPKATGGGNILHSPSNPGITFGFNAQLQSNGNLHGRGTVIDHRTNTRIKILNVVSLAVAGRIAIFTGQCEVNGAPENYRIEVEDVDEPGILVDGFTINTDSYPQQSGRLTGGNIQVRGVGGGVPTPTPTPIPD
ncbi:MAG TPA: post-COAP-1 domain-containing protein [Pyrinomonadaceae bacterium]